MTFIRYNKSNCTIDLIIVSEMITCKVYASSDDFFLECLLVVALQKSSSLLQLYHLPISLHLVSFQLLLLVSFRLLLLQSLFFFLLHFAHYIGLPIFSLLCVDTFSLLNAYIVSMLWSQTVNTLSVSGWRVADRIGGSIAIFFILLADMGWIHVGFFFIFSAKRLGMVIILLLFLMLLFTAWICLR